MQKKSQRLLPHSSHTSAHTHISCYLQVKLKEQSQNHSDLHDWLGTSQHQCSVVFLSLISPFHLPLALSGSILPHLSPLMTGFLRSLTILTKHQAWAPTGPMLLQTPNSWLSGSSCASILLPMPDSRQRSAKCVVKSPKIVWKSHAKEISTPSTAFFSHFRSYSHIMWSPMKCKWTSSNSL